jgi:hypothetical protein
MDYREIPAEFEKAFDAFISVEMLEVRILVDHLDWTDQSTSMSAQNTTICILNLSTLLSSPN